MAEQPDLSEPEDRELLEAWRGGDKNAGSTLVRRHFSRVYRFFRRRFDERETATELTQRTFATCLETRENLRDDARFAAFVLGVARNHLLRHLRARGIDAARDASMTSLPASQLSPSGVVAMREEQRILLQALRTLPIDLQLTVELFYWEELTVSEVGALLGVAPGTIKWRLSRARELLREEIERSAPADLGTSTLQGLEQWAQSLRKVIDEQE